MNSLCCCSPVLALNSGFLGHMHKRQSQPHLKLDIALKFLIHKELGNNGNTHLPVQKVHWKNYALVWSFFLVCGSFPRTAAALQRFKAKVLYGTQFHSKAPDQYKEHEEMLRPSIFLSVLAENFVPNQSPCPSFKANQSRELKSQFCSYSMLLLPRCPS